MTFFFFFSLCKFSVPRWKISTCKLPFTRQVRHSAIVWPGLDVGSSVLRELLRELTLTLDFVLKCSFIHLSWVTTLTTWHGCGVFVSGKLVQDANPSRATMHTHPHTNSHAGQLSMAGQPKCMFLDSERRAENATQIATCPQGQAQCGLTLSLHLVFTLI